MAVAAVRGIRKETVPGIPSRLPALAAETFGTFVLVLSGTATLLATARIGHGTVPGVAAQVAVAVAFGFGILAALANWAIFGDKLASALDLGTTSPGPGVSAIAALLAEFVITAVLLVVVLSTAVYERAPGGAMPAGLAIGLWIGAAVFLAFPISGGSLNPARTLGPDIVSAAFPSWWIYIIGPLAGAAFGGWIWQFLKQGRQPDDADQEADQGAGQRAEDADGKAQRSRPGKFVVEKGPAGKYRFTLVASNGQVIATSEPYERRETALNGIESVRKNAPDAEIADQDGE